MKITCPYCNTEQSVSTSTLDIEDEYVEDYECSKCGKTFDIAVEFIAIGTPEIAKVCTCDLCKGEYKDRYLFHRISTVPYPADWKYDVLCKECYLTLMTKQWREEDKRK